MLIDRRIPNLPSGVERYRVPGGGGRHDRDRPG
jgi:hypothetical protein